MSKIKYSRLDQYDTEPFSNSSNLEQLALRVLVQYCYQFAIRPKISFKLGYKYVKILFAFIFISCQP